jgi:hypothetical protein
MTNLDRSTEFESDILYFGLKFFVQYMHKRLRDETYILDIQLI